MPTRRQLLIGAASLAGATALGRRAAASVLPVERRFVFVFARGGWDNTRVLSPKQGLTTVATEADATVRETAGLTWVHHPDRPHTAEFFRAHAARSAILDGMLVRSVNHRICERLVLTASSKGEGADWATVLGAAVGEQHALPSIVLSGPTQPGPLARYSSVVGSEGQMQALLDGSVFDRGDMPVFMPPPETSARVEQVLQQRVSRALAATDDPALRRMLDAYDDGLARVQRLRTDAQRVDFEASTVVSSMRTAATMLSEGVARCVSVDVTAFDTHAVIATQTRRLEVLFEGLNTLMADLDALPGRVAPTLAEETTVVVLSEMGRTPYLNNRDGKDHWPYTAAMLVGSGVRGGHRVGGHDDNLNGLPIDLRTGLLSDTGTPVKPEHLGATLLALGGVDPSERLPGISPIEALLA